MKIKKIINIIGAAIILLGSSYTLAYAQNQAITCPSLTVTDVEKVINNGTISTEQGYTLADEAMKTRAQVLIDEPTANPFDTYYTVYGTKTVLNQTFLIFIGNVLGKDTHEAKERMKKILLNDEKVLDGKYDPETKFCVYKQIDASSSIANYPFKSEFETVQLAAVVDEAQLPKMMMKKHHA